MSIDIINLSVEDAIAEHVAVGEDGWFDSEEAAEAAIAAATPHIRAAAREALFDELIANAYGESFCALELHCDTGSFGGSEYLGTLIDWLTARKNKENTQP